MSETKKKTDPRKGGTSEYGSGRGNRLKPGERAGVMALGISGLSGAQISKLTGRSQHVVGRILRSEEMQEAKKMARSTLTAHAASFAEDWVTASREGAKKGRHDAARDALLAVGAIEDKAKTERNTGFVVRIGVALPGLGLPSGVPVESPIGAIDLGAIDAQENDNDNG